MSGTVVNTTGPVSTRVQLDGGSVVQRHQDRVRACEKEAVADTIASEVLEATPMAISVPVATPEPDASSDNTRSIQDTPEALSKSPAQPPEDHSSKQSPPVRRRA